ncbi:DUF3221 domain-containing protein [Bacillus infantis]
MLSACTPGAVQEEFKELEVGQKVSVTHQGMAQESLPLKTGAERIEVLGE